MESSSGTRMQEWVLINLWIMRIETRIILLFLLTIFLGGCFEKHDQEKKSTLTVITGNVRNIEVYPDTKEFSVQIIDFRGKKTIFTDSIKNDGTFKIEFELYKTQDLNINPIVGKIIASPGDSIHLEIDFKDIGNVRFFGDNQQSNMNINKYLNSNYGVFEFSPRETQSMSLNTYKSFCDSIKSVAEQKRQKFIREINPSPAIRRWTKDYITINYQKSLLFFPLSHAHKNNIAYRDLDIPRDYYSFLEKIERKYSDSIVNTNIYELLGVYTSSFAQRTINFTKRSRDSYISTIVNSVIKNHEESYFRQILIGSIFYEELNYNNLDLFEENKILLNENVSDGFLITPLNKYYEDLREQKKNPEINSNEILSKLNGTTARPLIDSILLANQGKVLYIDFWATWCGPCKEEMLNSKKLKHILAGEDVEFVYLCLQSKKEQWKSDISQMQLDGQHYFCDIKQSRNIRKTFDIKSLPHYMLVNKNGHIIESGFYLRPMSPRTFDKIDKLLAEE